MVLKRLFKLLLFLIFLSWLTGLKIFPYPDDCTYQTTKTYSYQHPLGEIDKSSFHSLCGLMMSSDKFVGHFIITDITIAFGLIYLLLFLLFKKKIIQPNAWQYNWL